jgi:hypothetical protein
MRHRSHIAFILLAAALFTAPQMAQDLSALKGAVAARIRGEIMQAFLGLHSNEAATAKQSPRVEASLLACGAEKSEAQPARVEEKKAAERTAPARRVEARAQTAMLTSPSDKDNAGLPPGAVAAELASLPRQVLTETRLAMLTQPGNGVEPPPALAFRHEAGGARTKSAPAARDKFAELERHAVFFQARFERGADAEWFRRAAGDAALGAVEGAKAKVRIQKARRPAKACGSDNTPCAFVTVPVASLSTPDAIQISDGE